MSTVEIKALVIGFFLTGLLACQEAVVNLDYCKMISEDQSYINTNKTDLVNFEADRTERDEIIKRNFELIMHKTKQEGFPSITLNNSPKDSCKHWAVLMTMIHTAQSNPNTFFSKEHADLFKREMDKGNIEKKLLVQSSIITARTIDLCSELKPKIAYATKKWGIDFDIFNKTRFIPCK